MDDEENKNGSEQNERKLDEMAAKAATDITKKGAKATKDLLKLAFKAIGKAIASLVSSIGLPLVIGGVIAGLIIAAVIVLLDLFGDDSVSSAVSKNVIENEVSISTSDEGYYFKLDQNVVYQYKKAMNEEYETYGFDNVDIEIDYDDEDDDGDSADIEDEEDEEERVVLDDEEYQENEDEYEYNDDELESWFSTDDDDLVEEYLVKMLKAEIASSYPKLSSYEGTGDGENLVDGNGDYVVQGVIKIHRTLMNLDGSSGGEIELTYLPRGELQALISESDMDALNYFSFDPETQTIYYAIYTKTEVYVNGQLTSEVYVLQEDQASYAALVDMCSMPYNFLYALLRITENSEWVSTVADLLLEDTDIVLMIQDQLSINTYTEDYWQVGEMISQLFMAVAHTLSLGDIEETYYTWETAGSETTEYTFPDGEETEIITKTYTNTANAYIQKAYTWFIDYEQSATLASSVQLGEENYQDQSEYYDSLTYNMTSSNSSSKGTASSGAVFTQVDNYVSSESLLYYDKNDYENYTWNIGIATEKNINYERFLGTWKNDTGQYYDGSLYKSDGKEIWYYVASDSNDKSYPAIGITDSSNGETIDYLLELLSRHEDTQLHLEIMKYFWNIYMNEDIYDVDIDELLNSINTSTTTTVGGSALSNFIKAWENAGLWNYESGRSTTFPSKYLSSDEQYYIVYEDGSAGHNNVSYGIATFISSSSNAQTTHPTYGAGYYNWQSQFASYGVDVTSLSTGSLVPVDAANSVFELILDGFESKVDTYLSNHGISLSQTERDALVAVCYQYGNINGFAEAYNKSLNSDGTVDSEAIKTNFVLTSNNGTKPFNYSSTSDRKYANWYLFTEGVYLDSSGNIIQATSTGSTSSILEWAQTIHNYMSSSSHLYYYCTGGGESSKSVHTSAGLSCGLSSSFEASKVSGNPGYRLTCCSTYVSWVLEEAGLINTHTNNSKNLASILANAGWTKITSYSELQAGDIVFMDTNDTYTGTITHVQIYAGNGSWYNAGSNSAIQAAEPKTWNASSDFIYAYRLSS